MKQTILPQLQKNILINCNKNDLKSIIMTEIPPYLKEMKLNLGNSTICSWTTFKPNVNLLEQWLYDSSQIIPVSYAWAFTVVISFIYHDSDNQIGCVKRSIQESVPEIMDDECTIYDEHNDRYVTGKRVVYNIKETIVTEFYSPQLIIETVESSIVTPDIKIESFVDYYEMKMWQKIKIKYTPEEMERVFNNREMKLENGGDVMEKYRLNNEPFDVLVVNTLYFKNGCGGFRYSW